MTKFTKADTTIERFLRKFRADQSGCWLWTGAQNGCGYGQLRVGNKPMAAHRLSYEIHVGLIPDRMDVCHSCDVPLCVNPAHLFIGPRSANNADMVQKGRHTHGEASRQAKLTDDAVRDIRSQRGKVRQHRLAEKYGVSQSLVSLVQLGKTWKLMSGEVPSEVL